LFSAQNKEDAMDKIQRLKARALDLGEQASALIEKGELTDEDQNKVKSLLDEADKAKAEAASLEAKKAEQDELKVRAASLAQWGDAPQPRKTKSSDANPVTSGHKELIEEDPKAGWRDFGEFASAVHEGSRFGTLPCDLGPKAALGNNTFNGDDGGFLIPRDFSNQIIERTYQQAPVLEKCDRLTLSGNAIDIPGMSDADRNAVANRHGGVVVYWVGEGQEITRSSLKFRNVSLKLNKIAALSYMTDEMLQDVQNLPQRLIAKMGDAVADELVEAIMFGDGVAKPLGAFAAGNGSRISQGAEGGQGVGTVILENVLKMQDNLWAGSEPRADWYTNKELRSQLRQLHQVIGVAGAPVPLFERGNPDRLDGRTLYFSDHCEAAGTVGDICLGDFSQYFFASKGTPQTAMSMHLRFAFDEMAWRVTFRVDGKPAWEQSLRPRKGAALKRESPFVVLAAR
jgi:HK97 family phage major capsid protein